MSEKDYETVTFVLPIVVIVLFCFVFETGSCYVALTVLELVIIDQGSFIKLYLLLHLGCCD